MARRNPMNARYQKSTTPAGKTRRSAAAAKPKRDSATGSSSTKKTASGRPKPKGRTGTSLVMHPPTPEYRRLRKIWWAMLGVSMVLAAGSWWLYRDPEARKYGVWVLAAAYGFIAAAIYIDFAKIRPIRLRYTESQKESHGKKTAEDSSADDES